MGYFIKELDKIVKVTEPSKFSLSANPNFVEFEALAKGEKPYSVQFTLTVAGYQTGHFVFALEDPGTGYQHTFLGLEEIPDPIIEGGDEDEVYVFEISENKSTTASNIATALKKDSYISKYFNIEVKGNVVYLKSKDATFNPAYLFKYISENKPNPIIQPSANPSFIDDRVELELDIIGNGIVCIGEGTEPLDPIKCNHFTKFIITESRTKTPHSFEGTFDIDSIGGGVFYMGEFKLSPNEQDLALITENLKNCLQANYFIGRNFDVSIPLVSNDDGTLEKGIRIKIRSKGNGEDYAFSLVPDMEEKNKQFFYDHFMKVTGETENIVSNDSFSEGHSPVELHLELYRDTGIFPGMDGTPNDQNIGSYVTTLTKSYANSPLWFNVNVLESKDYSYDFLNNKNLWFNTGTIRDFRFAAKRLISTKNYYENSLFYYSDVFYAVNGYQRTLEANDLSAYVYDTSKDTKAKPLTTQPQLFHIGGQTQYFNFLLSDADHDNEAGGNLAITYRILSQSGRFLAEKVMHAKPKHQFHAVNTIRLDIDGAISEYPNAGRVEISLSRSLPDEDNYIVVSEPLRFRILPSCLHKVNDFAFLNSLGGWSSFNFGGTDQSEFKTKTNTIFKTHTPDKNTSSELEAVFSKDVEEQFSVQTMPVTREIAEWLRELSTSKAVYELSSKRYVIVDELVIKPNSKDDLFRLDMKYRYSDTYNAK